MSSNFATAISYCVASPFQLLIKLELFVSFEQLHCIVGNIPVSRMTRLRIALLRSAAHCQSCVYCGSHQHVTYEKFHFRDFLVNVFHELDNKVDELMLQHLIRMEVRY